VPGTTSGARNEWRNIDLVNTLLEVLAADKNESLDRYRKLITFVKDRPGHDRRYAIDCSRIERELGWVPRHDFASGLRETVRWYLSNLEWVRGVRTGEYRSWLERNYGRAPDSG